MTNITETPLSIDDIISDLRDRAKIDPTQAKRILELEYNASQSERSSDAKINIAKMSPLDPERIFVESVLRRTETELFKRIAKISAPSQPKLRIVTGAPGSGKSTLAIHLSAQCGSSVYLCGDMVKATFAQLLTDSAKESSLSKATIQKYRDAVYIHRLTSPITWKLLSDCVENKRSIVLEMIGSEAAEDAATIRKAYNRGYKVQLHHVACDQERAIESAVNRYFSTGATDSGRYISLVNIANKQSKILECFRNTVLLLRDIPCDVLMYDNSEWKMLAVYRENSLSNCPPDVSGFQMPARDRSLWYAGANPSADVVPFSYDKDGDLSVLVYRRNSFPFTEHLCLPGGFLYTSAEKGSSFLLDMESPAEGAYREFKQRTYYDLIGEYDLVPVGVYKKLSRDPRNSNNAWVESHAFAFFSEDTFELVEYEESCRWTKVKTVLNEPFVAFDHSEIIMDAANALRLSFTRVNLPRP
jgi:ADP-ribose pyrophosphatase YjhB (NUDIX family)/predicted ABC-type ATPase